MNVPKSVEREVRGKIMRTDVFVRLVSGTHNDSAMNRDLDDAFSMFRDTERRFSRFRPDSELSRFNGTTGFRVTTEFRDLLSESVACHLETDGLFDPSILPDLESLGYAGSFGSDTFGTPSESSVNPHVPFSSLTIDLKTGEVRKPKELRIDLGGIAKGYAVDRVAKMLRERGYVDFFIDAGGDMYAAGRNVEEGYPYWVIGIAMPDDLPEPMLLVRDRAVATSGTDRRRWMTGSVIHHHLIDPRTGRSAETDLRSVTVLSETTTRAEVIAKALCILGRERARFFAEERGIPTFLVSETGETVYTDTMKQYLYETPKSV
ncbi:MAG: FAD:protein FMN transferase [Candidatus Moranbacteria bacterium]|nr:FAD:protein FMN transferase [Candidatus Moranbacteria bacterium]